MYISFSSKKSCLLLLLLGRGSHLLVKGAVRNLETGQGGDAGVQDRHQYDEGDQAHEDTCERAMSISVNRLST